jgi:CPA2 family monovalent cation:H+ antiporter-2
VFFVFFGLQTDPSQLPPVAGVAALLAVIGILTKAATGWIAAARSGLGPAARIRAGAALVPRGEFNIVIAGLAVAAGVDARLGSLAAAYVLILAVAGPLAARAAEPLARALTRPSKPATASPPP